MLSTPHRRWPQGLRLAPGLRDASVRGASPRGTRRADSRGRAASRLRVVSRARAGRRVRAGFCVRAGLRGRLASAAALLLSLCCLPGAAAQQAGTVKLTPDARVNRRLTLDVVGHLSHETGSSNPFTDARLDVRFVHPASGTTWVVPGYFAADGDAGETGAASGRIWRAHFTPHAPGAWSWTVDFKFGPWLALSPDSSAGTSLAGDGKSGWFSVAPAPADSGSVFREGGRLHLDGGHYLRLAGSGAPWLQTGTNSPENLLGYAEFDQTPDGKHRYLPHVGDWAPGDPTWRGGFYGRGLIGALNYLSSVGVNAMNLLVFNVGGDGDDVWPWISKHERLRFDCSKLDQWELVFEHMDDRGLAMQLLLGEQEIDDGPLALDGGTLGVERSLFHRELLARFGHHLGLIINLGEENQNTTAQQIAFEQHLRSLDAYDHPVTVHTFPTTIPVVYPPLLDAGVLQGASLQVLDPYDVHQTTRDVRAWSDAAGTDWVVNLDELGPPDTGVLPDSADFWHEIPRLWVLWGNLMAGGGGSQWYFGYGWPHNDLNLEDFRSREHMFVLSAHARGFFEQHLPFAEMEPADEVVVQGTAWCLAKKGRTYAAYLPFGGEVRLKLPEPKSVWRLDWFDPRHGGDLLPGGTVELPIGGMLVIEAPDLTPDTLTVEDWALRLERVSLAPEVAGVAWADTASTDAPPAVEVQVLDGDGAATVVSVSVTFRGPSEEDDLVAEAYCTGGGTTWQAPLPASLAFETGPLSLRIRVADDVGLETELDVLLEAP